MRYHREEKRKAAAGLGTGLALCWHERFRAVFKVWGLMGLRVPGLQQRRALSRIPQPLGTADMLRLLVGCCPRQTCKGRKVGEHYGSDG